MKLTKEHILELFRQLPVDISCDYVNPGIYSVRRKPIEGDEVHFALYENEIDSNKDVPLTEAAMETMANAIKENSPISIDAALVNGGNKRSAIEGALIRTSEFYSIKRGRNKNIVWIPSKPHPVGEKGIWNDGEELPPPPDENTPLMPIKEEELRANYSIEELGRLLADMVRQDDKIGIVATCAAFGLKYGKAIIANGYKAKELIDAANNNGVNIDHAQDGIINTGKSLYEAISRKAFGINFSKKAVHKNIMNTVHNVFLNYLTALRTKPFMLLAGISGTGKSRIVRKLAQATVTEELQKAEGYKGTNFANDRWTLHSPANFELIQVKPNWHNSMDVIGYLSNIPSPHYVFTPFIEFIVKAWQHPEVPFFLCLDEMNLAPVEEYFAEFLSAIESRSFEGGEYLTDPIIKPFNSFGEDVAKKMVNTLFPNFTAGDTESAITKVIKHFRTRGLTLPRNLIVIGTVNMDETTFSFSRKVLDRAMSVEMNEVNYDSFLTDTTDDDLKAIVKAFEENDDADLNALLVDRHIEAREIIDDLGDDARFTIDYLKRINALLEGTPFKLGYRAANEALIYLQASQEFGQTDRISALDNFTLMKVLSRVEGDETKLKITDSEADKERIAKAEVNVDEAKQYGDLNILTALRHIITNQLGEQDKLHSVKKIDSMLSQLKRDHFVSFWN
jgi:5-methylcytosine-specific restriction enzyme B